MSDTGWRDVPAPDPAARRAFLDARRRSHESRMDTEWAPVYDAGWGEVFPSHDRFVRRLLAMTRPRGTILDAPCGTGKYWPHVLESGRTVVGIDQSAGMLAMAATKHPEVPAAKVGLQELAFDGLFDAVICIDSMENIGPEDWPVCVARLAAAARPGAPLYITVELLDEGEAGLREAYETAHASGVPVVPGEHFDGFGYHFYPDGASIERWIAGAGLVLLDTEDADEYRHLLLRRTGG